MADTLGKLVSEAGFLSRRKAETAVRSGRARIDGRVVLNPAERIAPGMRVTLDGRLLEVPEVREKWYVMLNKPAGYVCTASDAHAARKALDLIVPAPPVRLFSVGRLDKESCGLILFTNDGEYADKITHPRNGIVKRYAVKVAGAVTPAIRKQMLAGIRDEGEELRALSVRSLGGCRYELRLNEGKKREIRRLTAALGVPTLELERLAVGALELGRLPRGAWRRLGESEAALALLPGLDPEKSPAETKNAFPARNEDTQTQPKETEK